MFFSLFGLLFALLLFEFSVAVFTAHPSVSLNARQSPLWCTYIHCVHVISYVPIASVW